FVLVAVVVQLLGALEVLSRQLERERGLRDLLGADRLGAPLGGGRGFGRQLLLRARGCGQGAEQQNRSVHGDPPGSVLAPIGTTRKQTSGANFSLGDRSGDAFPALF